MLMRCCRCPPRRAGGSMSSPFLRQAPRGNAGTQRLLCDVPVTNTGTNNFGVPRLPAGALLGASFPNRKRLLARCRGHGVCDPVELCRVQCSSDFWCHASGVVAVARSMSSLFLRPEGTAECSHQWSDAAVWRCGTGGEWFFLNPAPAGRRRFRVRSAFAAWLTNPLPPPGQETTTRFPRVSLRFTRGHIPTPHPGR